MLSAIISILGDNLFLFFLWTNLSMQSNQNHAARCLETKELSCVKKKKLGSSQNINSQNVNCQNVNSQNVNCQNVNSQNVNSQNVNSQNVNSQNVNSQNSNSNCLRTCAAKTKTVEDQLKAVRGEHNHAPNSERWRPQ